MTYYNADATDLFLFALSKFFDIKIVIFKSDERKCWTEDLMENDDFNKETFHFVKTLSQHIDPVVHIPTQDT